MLRNYTLVKAYAYITRRVPDGGAERQVLVFTHRDHPEAGVQVPGGTVEPDEWVIEGLLREVEEESGLTGLIVGGLVERHRVEDPLTGRPAIRHFFQLHVPDEQELPGQWQHTVTAGADDHGAVFCYEWLSLAEAHQRVWPTQGAWLPMLAGPAGLIVDEDDLT